MENEKGYTPEEVELEKLRAKTDEGLIRRGAEIVVDEKGERHLETTEKQKKLAEKEKKYEEDGYLPEIKDDNERKIEELEEVLSGMNEKIVEFTNSVDEETREKNQKEYDAAESDLKASADQLKKVIGFFKDNFEEFYKKSFSFRIPIEEMSNYRPARFSSRAGDKPFLSPTSGYLSDWRPVGAEQGRVRIEVRGPNYGEKRGRVLVNHEILDIYFPMGVMGAVVHII